jgi:nitrogen fixation protein NifU and related proteins
MSSAPTGMDDLYRELVADHAKQPRNFREMPDADHRADGHNRVCGDKLTVWAKVSDGKLVDVCFKGSGCAISTSSASMMTEAMKGKTLEESKALFVRFHEMLTAPAEVEPDGDKIGKLAAFAGVRKFPIRVKCATLPWHTLVAALNHATALVSNEK